MSGGLRVHALIDTLTWGGAEMLLAELAAGAPDAGIELSVGYLKDVDGSPAAGRLELRGVVPELVPISSLVSRGSVEAVKAHLRAARPDVVHTHLLYADVLGGLAARQLGLPSVSTVHVMQLSPGLRERVKTRIGSAVRRRTAARVIAVSEAARRWLVDVGWDRPERIVTVHNGVAAQARPGDGRRVREELGIAPDDVVALMLTVLREGKGHDVAIEAASTLRGRFPELRLLIAGDGPDRGRIAELARRHGDLCVLAGHRDDVMEVLDAADVLLHPSSVDAFPTALLEAMAAGVPIVSTTAGGIPEIVDEGETGALVAVPPRSAAVADALAGLLADPSARERMGARARERFEERFTAARWAERLRSVYAEVASGSTNGASRRR